MGDLRLILSGICLVLLAGIWWWGSRGSRQARGTTEPPPPLEQEPPTESASRPVEPEQRWGVPPLEPLTIKTAEFEPVPHLEMPMLADEGLDAALEDLEDLEDPEDPENLEDIDLGEMSSRIPTLTAMSSSPAMTSAPVMSPPPAAAVPEPAVSSSPYTTARLSARGEALDLPLAATITAPVPRAAPPTTAAPRTAPTAPTAPTARIDRSDRFSAPARGAGASELQKIVAVRVCALGESRWSGAQLRNVLESQGLTFGRYQVYHRKHADGRSLFCVASLVEPGTFDSALMDQQEFRGVSLFAVLPGPVEPLPTLDALLGTARSLGEQLPGMLQDSKGLPLSPLRAAELREEVARFQTLFA